MRLTRTYAFAFACALACAPTLLAGDDLFYSVSGSQPFDYLGTSVAAAGDMNKDGYPDFVVGAPGLAAGYVRVISGLDRSVIRSWSGDGGFGNVVDGGGDANGDGYPDVIVGGDGSAHVYSGKDGSLLLHKSDVNTVLGFAVAFVGDVDQDGGDDFLASAPFASVSGGTYNGYVQLYSGKTGAVLRDWHSDETSSRFGWSVSRAGDINKDGVPDVIISAPHYFQFGAPTGAVWIFSGKTGAQIAIKSGPWSSEYGWKVAGGFDLDHDGYPDYGVGAPEADTAWTPNVGTVSFYSGKDHSLLWDRTGTMTGARLGTSIASIGDFTEEGADDVIVGEPGDTLPGVYVGSVTMLSGTDGLGVRKYGGDPNTSVSFGASVSGIGDLNQDGTVDFLVGDLMASNANGMSGNVYAYSGRPYAATWSNYGSGWAGKKGVPALTSQNDPEICRDLTLELTNTAGESTVAALFVGLSKAYLPTTWGGHLLVGPPWSVFIQALPTQGLTLKVETPCNVSFCGLELCLQGLEVDAGASHGISFTPGLDLHLGM
jgi:hypothetical protein